MIRLYTGVSPRRLDRALANMASAYALPGWTVQPTRGAWTDPAGRLVRERGSLAILTHVGGDLSTFARVLSRDLGETTIGVESTPDSMIFPGT